MGDLISRKALLKELENFSMKIGGSANAMALIVMGETKKSIVKTIERQPTAFDLESVISKFEEYKHQQSENEMLSDNGKWLVQRVIEECEKILKSAANATNGKIGGRGNGRIEEMSVLWWYS